MFQSKLLRMDTAEGWMKWIVDGILNFIWKGITFIWDIFYFILKTIWYILSKIVLPIWPYLKVGLIYTGYFIAFLVICLIACLIALIIYKYNGDCLKFLSRFCDRSHNNYARIQDNRVIQRSNYPNRQNWRREPSRNYRRLNNEVELVHEQQRPNNTSIHPGRGNENNRSFRPYRQYQTTHRLFL